jgi:sugar O-acyltransferase (sialic acid O-acetyltransferase NeuD family)
VVIESARAAGFVVLGYLSDPSEAGEEPAAGDDPTIMGLKRLGAIDEFSKVLAIHRHANGHAAIGDPVIREKWLDMMQAKDVPMPPVIHPTAAVSGSAKLGDGVFIGPNAVVNARTVIGRGAIVNSGAIVEHDCTLDSFCHVASGCALSGGAHVGARSMIGAGAVIIPRVRIGADCTLAAGAVAISDVPDKAMAMGVPARVVES